MNIGIILRYGFEGKTHTLQDIGEKMGVSRERIRQLELSGIKRLKSPKNIKKIGIVAL